MNNDELWGDKHHDKHVLGHMLLTEHYNSFWGLVVIKYYYSGLCNLHLIPHWTWKLSTHHHRPDQKWALSPHVLPWGKGHAEEAWMQEGRHSGIDSRWFLSQGVVTTLAKVGWNHMAITRSNYSKMIHAIKWLLKYLRNWRLCETVV